MSGRIRSLAAAVTISLVALTTSASSHRENPNGNFTFKTAIRNPNTFLYATGPITPVADTDYNIYQTYTLVRVDGPYATGRRTTVASDIMVPPANVGPKSTPAYEQTALQAVTALPRMIQSRRARACSTSRRMARRRS